MSAQAVFDVIDRDAVYDPAPGRWTSNNVRLRLQGAAETLKRLPGTGLRPSGPHSAWPDIVRGVWDHAQACARERNVLRPTPEAIDRMDAALGWLLWVEERPKRMVCFARAAGVGATRLATELGCDRKTIGRWRAAAEMRIAEKLNEGA